MVDYPYLNHFDLQCTDTAKFVFHTVKFNAMILAQKLLCNLKSMPKGHVQNTPEVDANHSAPPQKSLA